MNKRLRTLLCLLLAFAMVFSGAGCKKKKDNAVTSSDTADVNGDNSDEIIDDEPDDSDDEDDSDDSDDEDPDDWDEWDEEPDNTDPDEDEPDEDPIVEDPDDTGPDEDEPDADDSDDTDPDDEDPDDDVFYEPVVINNDKPFINNNFLGMNGVYFLFTHMTNPYSGITYTDEQASLELDRVQKMGVKIVRSIYSSGMIYSNKDHAWHWNDSIYYKQFIKTAKELEKRNIDIALNMSWALGTFDTKVSKNASTPDGYAPASFGNEGWGAESGTLEDNVKGYKKFIKDSILSFRANGVSNIKYLMGFTECNNSFMSADLKNDDNPKGRDYEKVCRYFDAAFTAMHEGLVELGMRNMYTTVGPLDNWRGDFDEFDEAKYSRLVRYVLENMQDKVDIIGSHNGYDRANSFDLDDFYARPERVLGGTMKETMAAGKSFWIDEFSVATYENTGTVALARAHIENVARGVAFGAMTNGIMNMGGVDNVFIWMLVQQQWPHLSGSGTEFHNGVQVGSGFSTNLYESTVPTPSWYAYSMVQKYVGQGKIMQVNDDLDPEEWFELYYSAIERNDGETTLVVTNYGIEEKPIEVTFNKSLSGKTFYRHTYTINDVKPTQEAVIPGVDGVAKTVTNGFYDTVKPYSVTVYTTDKN